jgi:hypothetical protein
MWGSVGGFGRIYPGVGGIHWLSITDSHEGAASVVLQKPIVLSLIVRKKLKNLSRLSKQMSAFPSSPLLSSMSVSSNLSPAFLLTTPIESVQESSQQPQKRCLFSDCKKKLAFSDFACRCGTRFCGTHRAAEDHKCTYDWKGEGKKTLGTALGSCVNAKLERI